MHIALSIAFVFGVLLLIEIAAHGAMIAMSDVPGAASSSVGFFSGLALSRLGTAVAFVGLWLMIRYDQVERIWTYTFFWWVMFTFHEIGLGMGPDYTWQDAASGIVAASISLPLSGLIVVRLLRS